MYRAVVLGFSAGGIALAQQILSALPEKYRLPIIIVGHLPNGQSSQLASVLDTSTSINVVQAADKTLPQPGHAYVAPANYHLLVEQSGQLALSVDEPVNSVRPSIDVLFETAAEYYQHDVVAVALSGASSDGVAGMKQVKVLGGLTICLRPDGTTFNTLPRRIVEAIDVDYQEDPEGIISLLNAMAENTP
jgi:two-component system chemotaxis response regulator CheB